MELNIREIPFSRYGSFFCISQEKTKDDIYLRDVHGGDEAPSKLFRLILLKDGKEQPYQLKASETVLRISLQDDQNAFVEIILPEENELHFSVQNVTLKLEAVHERYDTFIELDDHLYEYHVYPKEMKFMLINVDGRMAVDAPWEIVGHKKIEIFLYEGHFVLESYRSVYQPKDYDSFAVGKEKVAQLYQTWYDNMNVEVEKYRPSVERASYITWSSVVHSEGHLSEYAMYMSKLWMYNIWSWDNCFNALNLAKDYPELAFSQLKIFIDHQDESGAYPDFINDKFVSYNCIKPPIFAYMYEKMMKINPYFLQEDRLRLIYESTKKVFSYIKTYRTYEGRLPHYKHGNDSGWDNGSLFHQGMPVEAPDLASHLIKSLDTLARFAEILGEMEEAENFKKEADHLFQLLMDRLYDEEGFFGRVGKTGEKIMYRSSLLLRLPIIIGYRLDQEVMAKIVKDLEENFETKYGFATESYKSPLYRENGYWLGPIWAPVTYLFYDALKSYGYKEVANRIRDKYLDLTLVGGMAENFDPFTGKGLVDTSFTWTSSVFLLFLKDQAEANK